MFSSLSVCLSVCLLATFRKIFERICIKFSGKVGNGAMNKYLILVEICITIWMQGLFPYSSLLADTESCINRLRCATLQCTACTSRHRHSNYDVITSRAHDRQRD